MGLIALPFLRFIAWIYFLSPQFIRNAMSGLLGRVLNWLGLRSKVVRQNLELVVSNHPSLDGKLLFDQTYQHLGHLVFEVMMVLGPLKSFVEKEVDLLGQDNWREAHSKGKGVIFLSSHVGNWEVMSASGGLAGFDLMIVTKQLKPDWLHQAMERGRLKCQVKCTYEPKTLKDVLRHLKRGGTVGFVLDQYAGPPIGVRVPFLGINVGTASTVATLARRTGAPVLPVVNYRSLRGDKWVVDIQKPLKWRNERDSKQELAVNTALYAKTLESHVLDHPEQWLWIHRRFKGDLSPIQENEWTQGRARK